MKVKIILALLCYFFFKSPDGIAQDTLRIESDSINKPQRDSLGTRTRANRAALFSTILPGAGQFYNKKYWKLPILYGGLIAIGYAIEFNNRNYKIFRRAYLYRVDPDSTTIDDYVNAYPVPN